jgi:WD40 repeat protein
MLVLRGHDGPVHALAYAPGDVTTLASAAADGTVRLWNPAAGRNWATFRTGPASPTLAFSPDGTLLATGTWGGIGIWDLAMERHEDTLWLRRASELAAVAFLPDGTSLVAGSRNQALGGSGLLQLFCLSPREDVAYRDWRGGVECLAFSPDGWALAIAGHRHWTVELVNPDEDLERRQPAWKFQAAIRGLAFSPDGTMLAVAAGRAVELWDVAAGTRRAVLKGHRSEVRGVAFAPDGRLLLSGGRDRTVRLWDAAAGRERACFDWHVGRVHAVAFAPDGMTAAAAGEGGEIVVWDVDEAAA